MALTKVKIKLKSKGNPAPSAYSAASSPDMGKCIEAARLTALLAEKVDNSTFFEFRDLFDSLFEKVTKNGVTSIRAKHGLWTDEFLSARGKNEAGGGTGGLDIAMLEDYLTDNKYATQPWVTLALGNYYSKAEADARFLRQHQSLANYVTLGTAQVISGVKTFTQEVIATDKWITAKIITGETGAANNTVQSKKSHGIELGYPNRDYMNFNEFGGVFNFYKTNLAYTAASGNGTLVASITERGITAASFIRRGGTSSQFLKADGSVDSNTYLTSHQSLANYYTKSEVDAKDKRLVTYYTSRPTTANVNFGNNAGLYTFLATSSMTSGKPAGDGHILHMEWDNSLSWAGQIAVPNNGDMQWRHQRGNTWQAWRTILDSSNFNSLIGSGLTAYVRKAGDTMTGMLNIKMDTQPCLKLDSVTANKEVYMYVYSGGVAKTAVGWNNVHGSYIYNSPSDRYLGIKDNGTPHFQGNTLWHAGNDGSRSGLDADLLDGFHKSDIYDNVTAKLSSLNDVLNSNGIRIYGFGYGDSASVANKPAGNSDARGTIGFGGIYCPMQLSWQHLGTDLYIRTKYSGNWQGWKRIAFTTDNVASATRLQTPRTLWGQSFDGTGNVNGAMTVNYTGETGILLKRVEAGSGAFIRLYNNNQTTNHFRIGMYGAGYFGISYNSGADAIAVTTSGNVGIGTISPSRKLHVNGDIQTVSIYASNWFRSTGATGWYSETYGGGWYMNDTTWIRNFGNKGLYMGTAIIRTDNYFDREGYSGASWFNGYGAYNTAIVNNSGQTPLMVAYRSGQTPAVTGANRLFSLELLNTGTELRFSFGGFGNGGGCPVLMTSYGELRVGRSIQSTAWFSDSGQIRAHAVGTNYYLGMGAATDGYGVIQSSKVGTGAIPLLLNPKGGNVGINTSAPGYTLDVNGSLHVCTLVYFDSTARINGDIWTNGQFFLNASGYDQQPYMSGAFGKFNLAFHRNGVWVDTVMTIMPDGAANMTGPLHVDKGIYTEGYVTARGQNTSSDARLKDVTGNVELDIRAIARAPAVFFRWKDTGGEDVGSIAQYWQALMPQLTPRTSSGMLDLQYDKAALLGVVTVSRRVLDHEERIAALEAENASLKATIENMRGNA
ncbi:shufflon system plasmid conjugative transfer pilus tip adhesin PilV [Sangeribacter muris]|uniref:shufflon system plasmid conjugative transfer pilus tip adhesin PilV n=1 Tax=Sangeribacter muris TaxID=2880703 RepID=UPI00244E0C16|nr:shufflon system plasmid conjugative transfer pilus tip adhesin PilV [Sangeribacter muris]